MATPTNHDLKLVGTTSSAGGQFRAIRITGETVLNGDVSSDTLRCTGEIEIKGNLQVRKLNLTGECCVLGRVQSESLDAIGNVEVAAMRGNRIKISGQLKVDQSCEVETLSLTGLLEVGELISAEHLKIGMFGPCRAQEIGGGTIIVKRNPFSKLKNLFTFQEPGTLQADVIEGDTIQLEHVTANVVRGTRVTIGIGCQIGRVEYREALIKHPKAAIKKETKI